MIVINRVGYMTWIVIEIEVSQSNHFLWTRAADFEGLKTLFDPLRLQDRACTTRMLSVDVKRKQPGNANLYLKALEKRIKRWFARKDIVI